MWRAKLPKEQAPAPFEFRVTVQPPRPSTKFGFSMIEARDLVVGILLVSGVGLSMLGTRLLSSPVSVVIVLVLAFTASFFTHEMAHKVTAQRHGLWAEFRLTVWGALITLISVISPFKIISPGAVMIAGAADKDTIGKTAVSGPFINLVICAGFLALTFVIPEGNPFFVAVVFVAAFNAFIAVLNLLPFGILDGWKVFQWSKLVWALAFVSAIALLAEILAFYSPYIQLF
jgi:Zn-dependent protease